MLAKLARDDAEKYAAFWKEFGTVLKEGVTEDYQGQADLATRAASNNKTRAGNPCHECAKSGDDKWNN